MANPNLLGLVSVKAGHLATPTQVASGETAFYTVGSGKAAKIATLTLANTSGTSVTVAVSLLPVGATAGAGNRLLPPISLAAGDSTNLTEAAGAWLGEGGSVSVNASAATAVVPTLTGLEFT